MNPTRIAGRRGTWKFTPAAIAENPTRTGS
jgi:hypothetical protein